MKKIINAILEDPVMVVIRAWSILYIPLLKLKRNLKVGKKLTLKGRPIIEILGSGKIIIGRNVTLYSTSRQYFAHFSSKTRLFAEGTGVILIGDNTRINGSTVHAQKRIYIGKNCLIGANTAILDSNGHSLCLNNPEERLFAADEPKEVAIEDNVWVGANSIILKGARIGSGAIIGAGSVVINDIPSFCIARGNPAKVIESRIIKRCSN